MAYWVLCTILLTYDLEHLHIIYVMLKTQFEIVWDLKKNSVIIMIDGYKYVLMTE